MELKIPNALIDIWTKMIQVKTHVEIDVKDFVLGG